MSVSPTIEKTPEQTASATASASPRTIGEMLLHTAQSHDGVALESVTDQAVCVSYPQLRTIVTEIARGLMALGIERGDRVAILGSTSPDWVLADYGTLCAGAVVVPIYHTNSPEECAYVLEHSEARLVFCENTAQAAKISAIRDRCPQLKQVVLFCGRADEAISLTRLRRHASDIPPSAVGERLASVQPGDVATLVYTSGTTGPPKGCMLTHANFLAATGMYIEELRVGPEHSMYQFLPLAHVLARVAQAALLRAGARTCFWSGDPSKIVDELSAFEPTHFPAVPRIYEKVHSAIVGRVQDGPRLARLAFAWALHAGRATRGPVRYGRQPGLVARAQFALADRLVLAKVRGVFGPNHQLAMVGAAPVAPELLEFFDACGVLVVEGYGMTESCAAATLNTPRAVHFGTVGRPLPGTEIRIAADGEVLIRGPHVFKGYYKDARATAETLDSDGWLHSGDLGQLDADGFLRITGRKKDLIITSSGKNITPVNIESALRDRRYITEAVVYGDNRPYLVALLTLDGDQVAALARRLGIDADRATAARDPAVHAEIEREVGAVNSKFARIEQVKRFAILPEDFSQDRGELTPTLKVKRAFVYEKYADVFAGLYEDGGRS